MEIVGSLVLSWNRVVTEWKPTGARITQDYGTTPGSSYLQQLTISAPIDHHLANVRMDGCRADDDACRYQTIHEAAYNEDHTRAWINIDTNGSPKTNTIGADLLIRANVEKPESSPAMKFEWGQVLTLSLPASHRAGTVTGELVSGENFGLLLPDGVDKRGIVRIEIYDQDPHSDTAYVILRICGPDRKWPEN